MRLIDTDAEIARIKEEIKGYEERRLELKEKMEAEPNNNYNDWLEKIKQCEINISDCKKEIRMLISYSTAYDVDEVVRKLELCQLSNKGEYKHLNMPIVKAIEIVKGGGVE